MNIKKQNPWVCSLLFLLPRIFSPFSPFLVVYIWQCLRKWILNETKEAASDAMGTLIHFSEISMTFIVFVVIYFWVEVLNMFWSCKPFSKGCDGRNYLIADICHWLQNLSRKFRIFSWTMHAVNANHFHLIIWFIVIKKWKHFEFNIK